MDYDTNRIKNLFQDKKRDCYFQDEIDFMSYIFNMIIDSENYDVTKKKISSIYNITIDEINLIENNYFKYFATDKEKEIYQDYLDLQRQASKSSGFANISILISVSILTLTLGIFLIVILYNLK